MKHRPGDWQDGRKKRQTDDANVLERIHGIIGKVPTYGYRRVWALLRRQSETLAMAVVNVKRVYQIMCQHALLLGRKPRMRPGGRVHTGKVAVNESNQRWCSDGFDSDTVQDVMLGAVERRFGHHLSSVPSSG